MINNILRTLVFIILYLPGAIFIDIILILFIIFHSWLYKESWYYGHSVFWFWTSDSLVHDVFRKIQGVWK